MLPVSSSSSRREFDTPQREAWNTPIAQVLKAIDLHNECYWRSGDCWHLEKAEELRGYVREVKEWIKAREAEEERCNKKAPCERGLVGGP